MTNSSALAIVLAAGKGTRMKSERPKVLHALAGAPLLCHALLAAKDAGLDRLAVVVGPGMDDVAAVAVNFAPKLEVFVQAEQRGTADAVNAAREAIAASSGQVLILYGDTPLLRAETIGRVRAALDAGADLAGIGFKTENPVGYGRLLLEERGKLVAIREEK
ncbi:MAG: NTP transferase domain-containing protein, partial [Methyloceanibacter sp.]